MILAVPPKLEIPMPLSRPLMDVPFPGMTNVKSLGAVGDGVTDDTAAIQSALTKSRYVYFPAGTYLTSSTLQYTYKSAGGYIGGAGAGQTIIQRNFSQNGGVFGTQGFGYTTIQGITFQTAPYNASASPATTALNFDIEFTPGTGFASQENMFYDCVFDGGLHALAVGNSSTAMNSENMYNNCTFKNAYRGVAIGNYNALNNLVYNGTFDHDYIAISNSGTPNSGGSYSVFYGKATNIGYSTLEFLNSVDSTFAFYQLQSDAPNVFFNGYTTARFSMYFDQCTFTENAPPPSGWAIWTNSAMAVAFANSTMQGKVGLRGGAAAETFIKINSTINYSSGAPEYSGSAEATFPTINSAPGAPLPH